MLLGVYFAVTALYDLAYTWASARWFYTALQPFPRFARSRDERRAVWPRGGWCSEARCRVIAVVWRATNRTRYGPFQ